MTHTVVPTFHARSLDSRATLERELGKLLDSSNQ